ncbi:hypothetical protein J7K99_02855, partial [bacterium]|nr:hypothetical protein [bacterium]
IEGALTIVLGLEEIDTFENSNIFNLSFTVLTRAIFETMLFSTYDSPIKPTSLENLERLNLYLKSVFNEEN